MDEQEKAEWEIYSTTRSTEDRNRLVERYVWLAEVLARKFSVKVLGTGVEYDELLSAANEGLMQAVEKFDPNRSIKFVTYAPYRISNQIKDYLRQIDVHSRLYRIREPMVRDWAKGLDHEPTDDEVYEHFGFKLDVRNVISISVSSIHAGDEVYKRSELADSIGVDVPNYDPSEASYLLKGLTSAERLIVILYHVDGWTMKEIGKTLGLSESRISQQMKDLMPRMRQNFEKAA